MRYYILLVIILGIYSPAQVNYKDNQPWEQRTNEGPDSEVPGWYFYSRGKLL